MICCRQICRYGPLKRKQPKMLDQLVSDSRRTYITQAFSIIFEFFISSIYSEFKIIPIGTPNYPCVQCYFDFVTFDGVSSHFDFNWNVYSKYPYNFSVQNWRTNCWYQFFMCPFKIFCDIFKITFFSSMSGCFDFKGYDVPVVDAEAVESAGPAKPPPRIPVTSTGKPLPINKTSPKATKGKDGFPWPSENEAADKNGGKLNAMTNSLSMVARDDGYRPTSCTLTAQDATASPTIPSPAAQDRRQNILKFFTETTKKFDALEAISKHQFPQPEITDPFSHDTIRYGRSQQAKVMEGRTEMERTAWMLRNHLDYARAEDLTFYAPAPEDW